MRGNVSHSKVFKPHLRIINQSKTRSFACETLEIKAWDLTWTKSPLLQFLAEHFPTQFITGSKSLDDAFSLFFILRFSSIALNGFMQTGQGFLLRGKIQFFHTLLLIEQTFRPYRPSAFGPDNPCLRAFGEPRPAPKVRQSEIALRF